MARKRKAASRGTRLDIVKRSIAIAEVFRQSEGKRPFTIKALTDALLNGYPHLFPAGRAPDDSTITRAVDALKDVLTITRSTAQKVGLPVEGSPKQVVWTYTPGVTAAQSIENLSDHKERIDNLISLAVAVEAFAPLEGLPLYDSLVALRDSIEKQAVAPHDRQRAKRTSAKYSIGDRKKHRGTLRENQVRELHRTIYRCITENRRLEIRHKHRYGQKEEPTYVLEPHAFRTRNGSVFIYAHVVSCSHDVPPRPRDNLHQFKLDRITSAKALPQLNQLKFDAAALDTILATTIHNYLPPPRERPVENVVIEVRKDLAKWVEEEMLHPQQKTSRITLADGKTGLRVTIDKAYKNDITPRILGLGPYVKVIGPPELADHVRATLEKAAMQYQQPAASETGEGGKPPAPKAAADVRGKSAKGSARPGSSKPPAKPAT